MARKLRLQFEGAIYHVTVRGSGRRRIFRDDSDRERLFWRLSESRQTYDVRLYLVCLMDRHFHLVLETPRANLSRFMQSLLTGYSVYFNLRHNTIGHVMQGRYGAQLVEGNEYLQNLSRYVHLNPLHVRGMKTLSLEQKVRYLRAYRWSTYRGYIDAQKRYDWIDYQPVLAMMSGRECDREAEYREFVEAGLAETDDEFVRVMKSRPRSLGGKEFRISVEKAYSELRERMGSREDVSFRRDALLVEVSSILQVVAGEFGVEQDALHDKMYGSPARAVAARMLCRYADVTQREAGRILGYKTGSAVHMQLKRLPQQIEASTATRRHLSRIEKKIRTLRS